MQARVSGEQLRDAFRHMCQHARESKVHIFAAHDVDSLCSLAILTALLRGQSLE